MIFRRFSGAHYIDRGAFLHLEGTEILSSFVLPSNSSKAHFPNTTTEVRHNERISDAEGGVKTPRKLEVSERVLLSQMKFQLYGKYLATFALLRNSFNDFLAPCHFKVICYTQVRILFVL